MNICVDPFLQSQLDSQGVTAVVYDEVLSPSEKQAALEALDDFTACWFLDSEGVDHTLYRNVSLGAAVRDELMLLFHLVIHFAVLMNKYPGKIQKVYQSSSCLLPEIVENLITACGIEIVTVDASYPYVCFRRAWHLNARNNYAYVSFDPDEGTEARKTPKLSFRARLKAAWLNVLCRLGGRKQFYYAMMMRTLIPFYMEFLSSKNDYGLLLADQSKLLPEGSPLWEDDHSSMLLNLARKGVLVRSLRAKHSEHDEPLVADDFSQVVAGFDRGFSDFAVDRLAGVMGSNSSVFCDLFSRLLKESLAGLAKQVDKFYLDLSSKTVKGSILEMAHPLLLQVAANLGKTTYLVPLNMVVHNQYFNKYIADRCKNSLVLVAHSDYDKSRYQRQGISEDSIVVKPDFFAKKPAVLHPFQPLETLRNATVLIIPYFSPCLFTYRLQAVSNKVVSYLSDIFDVLEEVGVRKAIIRIHPGMDGYVMNETGYTFTDFNERMLQKALASSQGGYGFDVEMQNSDIVNPEQAILESDAVIGVFSGTILDALRLGRNYIIYDNSVSPYPQRTSCTIVYDGYMDVCKSKEALREAVLSFRNMDRDGIVESCFSFFKDESGSDRSLREVFFEEVE